MRTTSTRLVLWVAASAAIAGTAACSASAPSSDKASSGTSLGALSVGTRGDLPACNASSEATVAYVVDEKKIVACVSGAWTPVVFGSGPQGDPGAAGAPGAPGPSGADGANGAQGSTGERGPAGAAGAAGAPGIAGPAGAAGAKGDTGAAGATGEKGDTGAAGSPGLASLVAVSALAPDDPHCPFGGLAIKVGVDDDGDGILAVGEVDQTAYVCNASAPVRVRKVFVTSQSWSGALGGVVGADQKCQAAGDAVTALSGKTWKAWISETGSSPLDRFTKDGKFVRMDSVQVAGSFDRLFDPYYTQLDAPIALDESGVRVTAEAWGATQFDGTPYGSTYDCAEWTDGTAGASGLTGLSSATSSSWEVGASRTCDQPQHLYCFEQ